ncbi:MULTISPECIES: GumC family protein [Olivibacter]|uniref:non-specific protein-tyrosine kinase n=1 Tax=Olivibacter jilunii TaxID=985016 RepID=A0ABW6B680_9SPHI
MNNTNDLNFWGKEGNTPSTSLRNYAMRYFKSWPLLAFSLILCVTIAWFYVRYIAIPEYHVKAKLLIEDNNTSSNGGGAELSMDLGSLLGTKNSVDNEVEVLKTKFLMESLVQDLKLNVTWFKQGSVKDVEIFNPPFSFEIVESVKNPTKTTLEFSITTDNKARLEFMSERSKEVKTLVVEIGRIFNVDGVGACIIKRESSKDVGPSDTYTVVITDVDNRAAELLGSLTANLTSKLTTIIDLQLDYSDREKGEYILSNFIKEYTRQNMQDKSRIADSTIAFIDKRILLVNSELELIEQNIQDFMQGKGLANISAQSQLLLENNSTYIRELTDIEARMEVLDAVDELIKDEKKKSLISGSILGGQMDQAFNSLISSYNNQILERERLLLSFTPDNPFVVNADQRIASVKSNIAAYIRNTRESLNTSKKELEKRTASLQVGIKDVPAQERAFLDLSRQQQLKQELYLFLLQKREETAVANTSNIAGIRVIDPPKADRTPFSPKKSMIWMAALFIALLIPAGRIYAQDLLNDKVTGRKDVELRTKIPVLGELGHAIENVDLIEFKSSRSALAEQFRALRTNLQFMFKSKQDKVILVTSGMPGEGKSFTSLNLANVYAVSGKKVLLLEFDLRKPKLSKTYKSKTGVGISNFIVDENMSLDAFITEVAENLMFGPCGPMPPNPAELILNPRVKEMLDLAKERFDYVIVDAPPIGAVTDAQLLSDHCDVTLYVVRANHTPQDLLGLPEDMRREGKMKNMGIILNDVSENNGGYYGYNYGYYHTEEKKKTFFQNLFNKR